jgi:glutamate 5-kinase
VVGQSLRGEEVGTWIAPRPSGLSARKLWIAFGVPSRGELRIDDGAVTAIGVNGRSLLAVGIRDVSGDFVAGDAVVVVDGSGNTIAKGLTRLGSSSARETAGKHSDLAGGAVIHSDDLVVLV